MFQALVKRYGVKVSTGLVTGSAAIISAIVIAALGLLFGEGIRSSAILLAIIVPLLFYGPLVYLALSYVQRYLLSEQTLLKITDTDPVTGSANRKQFLAFGDNLFALAVRHGTLFSVILFDIDNFKSINDAHGQAAGDNVLRTVAKMCREQMRRSDTLVRLDSDEFACLLPHTSRDGAMVFAERLRTRVEKTTILVQQETFQYTISIGVVTYDHQPDLASLLQAAETAMRQAKQQGRNRTVAEQANPTQSA